MRLEETGSKGMRKTHGKAMPLLKPGATDCLWQILENQTTALPIARQLRRFGR
ncbi:hypothetical protein [Nitratireductor sp. XY-223]|uniref:hypothetical protein n=1 Tax=Nitratireductor sp. XY-223 TaxID=2561926 RepID=UPI00145AA230|nr:hypothetical protein [Nitratireductor sp. XY-223]